MINRQVYIISENSENVKHFKEAKVAFKKNTFLKQMLQSYRQKKTINFHIWNMLISFNNEPLVG